MAKYYKFRYSAGYAGTDVEEIVEVPDSYSLGDVQELFDEWYEEQSRESGYFDELSKVEAENYGIDETYCT